jgi:hypothetical protein
MLKFTSERQKPEAGNENTNTKIGRRRKQGKKDRQGGNAKEG